MVKITEICLLLCFVFCEVKCVRSQGIIQQALYLGDASTYNTTRDDCVWKRGLDIYDKCPDPDINLYLYSQINETKDRLDINQRDWLRNSRWDPQKDNIFIIHGYAGSDDSLPITVLRDAYLKHGTFNVFMADWGALAKPPCYVSAVHNLKSVARCLAESFTFLRDSGLKVEKTTCVGHSLGAHICGLISNYLSFRVERIIALDPARPLIKPGNANRLDSGDAKAVHVIDAYLKHGTFNVFMADWGALAKPPCYVSAVHNLKSVARCLAESFTFLRDSGLKVEKTTCVGHSLGAHICGLISNYLSFRVERIIALDPARPLIKPGNANRLDSGDAKAVHVIHTNAGYYGENSRVGHVDFCVNGGKRQPYCATTSNENLCSHIWSICYLAQSIFAENEPHAEPCARRCPSGIGSKSRSAIFRRDRSLARYAVRNAIPMGQHTPVNALGSYCLKDNTPPFCPTSPDSIGDHRCCLHKATRD